MYGSEPKIKSCPKTPTCLSAQQCCDVGPLHCHSDRRADGWEMQLVVINISSKFMLSLPCGMVEFELGSQVSPKKGWSVFLSDRSLCGWNKYQWGRKTMHRLNFSTYFLLLRMLPEAPELCCFGIAISAVLIRAICGMKHFKYFLKRWKNKALAV